MSALLPITPERLDQTVDGLILSGPLVPPTLEGRKTVTRRMSRKWLKHRKGDLLFVRETWRTCVQFDGVKPTELLAKCKAAGWTQPWAPIRFEADGARRCWEAEFEHHAPGVKRSSLLLPRLLSRCVLRLTEDPRVEPLAAITEEDAIREGAPRGERCDAGCARPHRDGFIDIWHRLHTKPGERWSDSPAVVRIAFERIA